MKNKIMAIMAMILLAPAIANALGVTPGRTTLNFEESLQKEVTFKVINNENKEIELAIYARGDLAEYVDIPVKDIGLSSSEESKELTYKISLPSEIDEPGLHEAEIVIREVSRGNRAGDISVGAMEAVITQLHVNVPYPGKYIVAKLDIVGGKTEERTLFFVPLFNFGEEDVISAKAEIIIMDMYQKVINKIETDEQMVAAKGRAELSASMDPSNLLPGVYRVIAKVNYDGITTTAENSFFIKDFLLIPLDISVRDFTLGDIAKFNILVENIGNVEVKDAYSLMLLNSKDGKSIASVKSVPIDFKPFEKKEMVSYWDTKSVSSDEYGGSIILRYEDKSDERKIKTAVGKTSIETEIIGVTGYAIREEKPSPQHTSPMVILVILLVVVNIGWFVFYFMHGRKK